jgi:hypothetical protein
VLIADSAVVANLEPGWDGIVAPVMRNPNILVHDRQTYRLAILRKVGQAPGLEFE